MNVKRNDCCAAPVRRLCDSRGAYQDPVIPAQTGRVQAPNPMYQIWDPFRNATHRFWGPGSPIQTLYAEGLCFRHPHTCNPLVGWTPAFAGVTGLCQSDNRSSLGPVLILSDTRRNTTNRKSFSIS